MSFEIMNEKRLLLLGLSKRFTVFTRAATELALLFILNQPQKCSRQDSPGTKHIEQKQIRD